MTGIGAALLLAVALAGCSSTASNTVQVVDRSHGGATVGSQRAPARSGHYRVQQGDTLYSIAFRFGWDWQALAAHNGIAAPYLIRPGQLINFSPSSQTSASQSRPATPVVQQARTQGSTAARTPGTSSSTTGSSRPATSTAPPPVAQGGAAVRSPQGWMWPAEGQLIGRFSSNGSLNKGIDIAGNMGQPVLAAAGGSVVYAGSGLRGYGELLIIKHNDAYVSAYGHNRTLLVKEGQQVKAGQAIAEMGSTGTDRVKLHFEIRRQGKPVDPLQYLPRR